MKSMDKHKICKICNRRFTNGKAMGGHMRSHLAKHPIPPKPNNNPSPPPKYPSSSSSLSNMRTYRSVNREFFDLKDESEAESLRNVKVKTRSERPCKTTATTVVSSAQPQPESVSSVTENIFLDKEVAVCLLMLSRDKWPLPKDKQVVLEESRDKCPLHKDKQVVVEDVDEYIRDESEDKWSLHRDKQVIVEEDVDAYPRDESEDEDKFPLHKDKQAIVEEDVDEYIKVEGEDESEDTDQDEDESCLVTSINKFTYKCKTCKSTFQSYQALRGDKVSHKKIKINAAGDDVVVVNQTIFGCPFCDNVFDSGQALDGHKKIHFSQLAAPSPKSSAKTFEILIDLNLPAPEDNSVQLSKGSKLQLYAYQKFDTQLKL